MQGTVVRSKSVEYMPFLLSFFIFLNSGVWTLYAFLLSDYFLGVSSPTYLSVYISGLGLTDLRKLIKKLYLFKFWS